MQPTTEQKVAKAARQAPKRRIRVIKREDIRDMCADIGTPSALRDKAQTNFFNQVSAVIGQPQNTFHPDFEIMLFPCTKEQEKSISSYNSSRDEIKGKIGNEQVLAETQAQFNPYQQANRMKVPRNSLKVNFKKINLKDILTVVKPSGQSPELPKKKI